jgi:flavin reductase (DIM6/NTAB) family NADH-FMN oxidoreductase RutF
MAIEILGSSGVQRLQSTLYEEVMELTDDLINQVTWMIPNALALVGSRFGDEWNGMTTSWITQVAQEPILIDVGMDKTAATHRLVAEGGSFTVNLWDAENIHPLLKFSKPATFEGMTLNGWPVTEGETGAPVFDAAMTWMECSVTQAVDCGSQTFLIGEFVAAGINDDEARPAAMSDTRLKCGGTRRRHWESFGVNRESRAAVRG